MMRLDVRTLLTGLVAALATTAVVPWFIGYGQTRTARLEAERLGLANRLADLLIEAAGAQALERGTISGNLGARTVPSGEQAQLIDKLRQEINSHLAAADEITAELLKRTPTEGFRLAHQRALHARAALQEARGRATTASSATPTITPGEWFDLATQNIGAGANLRLEAIPAPLGGYTQSFPLWANLVMKQTLWMASEHAGQERGRVAAAIGAGLRLDELSSDLAKSRAIFERSLAQILAMEADTSPAIRQRIAAMRMEFLEHFEPTRAQVYAHLSKPGADPQYPVTHQEWVRAATQAIDTLLALSAAVSAEVDERLDRSVAQARTWERFAAAILLFSIVLSVAGVVTIRKRMLGPLTDLQRTAESFGRGELSRRAEVLGEDEFDSLARSFNSMATALADERQQLQMRVAERDLEIAERKKAQATLVVQEAALRASASAIVITDTKGDIFWANPAFTALTGYAVEEVVGKSTRLLRSGVHDPEFYRALWTTILDGKTWSGEITNRRKDGSLYEEEMLINPVADAEGCFTHFVAVKHDISARKEAERQLVRSALYDSLTGLSKRELFTDRLERAVARALRSPSAQCAVLFIDLDNFKPINDTLGHEVGDRVLKETASRLEATVRAADMAARYGGDEFVVLLEDVGGPAEARDIAERVGASLREPFINDGQIIRIGASIGGAVCGMGEKGMTATEMLRRADNAMYRAKSAEKGSIMFS